MTGSDRAMKRCCGEAVLGRDMTRQGYDET